MDSGLTIRPIDGAAQAAVTRPNPAPVAKAVPTELAPVQVVTPPEKDEPARNDPRKPAERRPATKVDITFDKRTHMSIYRLLDAQTGRVIMQVPYQARADIKA